jgi:hypothetical protein
MAFDISSLTAYVANIDPTIFSKSVAGATTAKDLIAAGSVVFGKGRTAIRKMALDANFQSGLDSCARNASGDVTLTDTYFDIVRIKDEKNLCFQSLENTYFALLASKSIQPSEEGATPEFANAINDLRASKLAEANEKGIWKSINGVTASAVRNGITYGSDFANYSKYDGIIQQVAGGSYVGMTLSGSEIVAKLRNAANSVSVTISANEDFRMAIGQDLYNQYLAGLAALNIFKPTDDMTIYGTPFKFWVVPGLNGTNKVYALRLSNLRLGMASQDDMDRIDLEFVKDSVFHGWTSDVYFSIGVKVIDVTEVGYLAYS